MEPFSFIIQVVAAAAFSAMPVQPTTVPGTIDMVNVSNSSVITQTATEITEKKTAEEKALAEAVAKAIAKEEEKKKVETEEEVKKKETAKTAVKENLQLPLKAGSYSYTSDYGLRCAPVTGAGNFHFGIDFAAPLGTPLYAIADGTVVSVIDGGGSVGGDVRIESTVNGKLVTFRYHHMGQSSQYVKVGDKIKAGHHISDVASTGMSTGPHLHLEVFDGKFADQKHMDPEAYFEEIGLDVIAKASANYVDKHDHPTSCPGGTFIPDRSTLISASTPPPAPAQPTYSSPSVTPAAPAPKPAAPAPAPATPTPAPVKTTPPSPTPVPVPTPSLSPLPTVSPSAIPSLVPTPSVEVKLP